MRLFYFLIAFILVHCGNSLPQEEDDSGASFFDIFKKEDKKPEEKSDASEESNLPPGTPIFTFEQIKNLTEDEIVEVLKPHIGENKLIPYFEDLGNWKLYEMGVEPLDAFLYYVTTFGHLDKITSEQLSALSLEAFEEVSYTIKCLSPQQTKGLTPEQISSEYAAYDLTVSQIAKLNAEQVNAIGGWRFTPEEAQVISPEIISQLDYLSIPFNKLTKNQVEAIRPEQLSFKFGEGINRFLPEQIPWLRPDQIATHPIIYIQTTPEKFAALPPGIDKGPLFTSNPIKPELLSVMSLE